MGSPMEINLSIFNSKKLPGPFVLSLVLFTLLQVGLDHCPAFWRYVERNCRFHYDDPLRFESVLRRIPVHTPFKKVLLFGTSQAREGINVDYINEQFKGKNIRFYDLGVIGTMFPVDLIMFKDRILALKPDAVVYSPFVESFYQPYKEQPVNNLEYNFNPAVLPYLAKHLRLEDLNKDLRGDLLDAGVGSVSLFYRFRNHLGDIFYLSLKYALGVEKRPPPRTSFFTEPYSEFYYQETIEVFSKKEKYRHTNYTDLYQELFTIFAKDIVSHNIKLIVHNCPVHPLFPKICYSAILTEYHGFLKQQAREIGFTYTPNADLPDFKAEEFNDFTHLTRSGRERFTRFLVGYFERKLSDL